ncbi:helix-turn-helix domain-containing protein [Ammoniphilus sp. YIM 78166]|uniref:helix-turn-helix domain-containing protein n=1 Tax=Ammoniphilus sp. YIM 78166 TaxID=1644106 RepID=UPI00106F6C5C|nr:helix-turn-helix domain-containing protein [Ammoniphilus sp. YIM 78166]
MNLAFISNYLSKKFIDIPYQIWLHRIKEKEPTLLLFSHERPLVQGGWNSTVFHYLEEDKVTFDLMLEQVEFTRDEYDELSFLFQAIVTEHRLNSRETDLKRMMEITTSITSTLDREQILRNIIDHALLVLANVDAGYLLLFEEEHQRLIPQAVVGFSPRFFEFQAAPGEGITGRVFLEGTSLLYNSQEEIYEGMATTHPENYRITLESADTIHPKAMICVPVSIGEKRIGVLAVHQFYKQGLLTPWDVQLMEGFAAHTAIAIQNANLYHKAETHFENASKFSEQLRLKNELLEKRNQIHKELTKLSLHNKGIGGIIRELRQMLQRPLYFYDFINMEATRESPMPCENVRRLAQRHKNNSFDYGEDHQWLRFFPISSGHEILGCIVTPVQGQLPLLDEVIIEQGASILALEFMKTLSLLEKYNRKTHELFNELLQNENSEFLANRSIDLKLSPHSSIFLVIIENLNAYDPYRLDLDIHRLIYRIKSNLTHQPKLIYGFNNRAIALFSLEPSESFHYTLKDLQALHQEYEKRFDCSLRTAISAVHPGLVHARKCYEEAQKVLSFLSARKQHQVLCYEEMGMNRLFMGQQSEIESFIEETLSPLWRSGHDELEKTLQVFLSHNQSAAPAAEELHIHVNTLYKRLKKIEELLQVQFQDGTSLLRVQLAYHLKQTFL